MTHEPLTVEITELPEPKPFDEKIRRAPARGFSLNRHETKVALANAAKKY